MDRRSSISIPRSIQSAKSLTQSLFKQKIIGAARVMGPTLFALMFAGTSSTVAHAQGRWISEERKRLWGRSTSLRPKLDHADEI